MRKENEFGGVYHQMNFSREELEDILRFIVSEYEIAGDMGMTEHYTNTLNLIDRIEKELGIE